MSSKIATGCLVAIGAALVASFIIGLSIVVIAALAMLVCNCILPILDINFPITFLQGCGIGVIVSVLRFCFCSGSSKS
jgi:hypothetical protein